MIEARSCGEGYVQRVDLADDDLWRAIAENTNALSLLVQEGLELDAQFAASGDRRARIMGLYLDVVNRLQRDYSECKAELRRRYPCVEGAGAAEKLTSFPHVLSLALGITPARPRNRTYTNADRTMKRAGWSSANHGGGKRRSGIW
jgi:hypothetical protein